MTLLIADAATVAVIVGPLATLLGVVLGALLPRYLDARKEAQARYDAAIAAVTKLQAARWGAGFEIPGDSLKAENEPQRKQAIHELSKEGVREFLQAAAESRAALAALHPYSPDLKKYWDRFEIPGQEWEPLIDLLSERRRKPRSRHSS